MPPTISVPVSVLGSSTNAAISAAVSIVLLGSTYLDNY
nr:MAG TPA: hypothetical protein [Caudoviricetes sp.]